MRRDRTRTWLLLLVPSDSAIREPARWDQSVRVRAIGPPACAGSARSQSRAFAWASLVISAALDNLAGALPGPVVSISLRFWPPDIPDEIAVQRRAPYEARADAIMYRQLLAELARARGCQAHCYDAKHVEAQAAKLLGERAEDILRGPRTTLGPPWAKDHRVALAATVVAGDGVTRRRGRGLLSDTTPTG